MKVSASKMVITSGTKPEFHIPKSAFAKTEREDWNTLCTAPTTKHCLSKNTFQRYKSVTETPLYTHDSRRTQTKYSFNILLKVIFP